MPRRKLWLSKKDAAAINRFLRGVLSLILKAMRAREEKQTGRASLGLPHRTMAGEMPPLNTEPAICSGTAVK